MSQSPTKRRKLSPEPLLNATPKADRYPSFASPTRSTISRVAPQILQRRSMENDAPIQRSSALARTPPGAQPTLFVTQSSQGASQEQPTPSRPVRRSPRSNNTATGGGTGMASAPRRPSRSPQKTQPTPRAPDIFDEPPPDPDEPVDLGIENPFQKRSALRRSLPVGVDGQADSVPEPAANDPGRANPFQKRSALRRSPPPDVAPVTVGTTEGAVPTQEPARVAAPAYQPRRSMAVRERSEAGAAPTPEQAQNRAHNVTAGDVAASMPPPPVPSRSAAATAAALAASDGRAALRNQRLRGAQTRSPGQVDFRFNIPAAAPRPAPATSVPAPTPTPAAPIESVAAATPVAPSPAAQVPAIPAPFVGSSAPTPTPPMPPQPVVSESPLFVSQNTNSSSALPNIDSSILSTHTPTPAPLPPHRKPRAAETQPARPEGSRHRVSEAPREEPELPPTPTQRGIADPDVTSPRTGIHNTPSKRLKRRTLHQSSPLKPREVRPESAHRAEPIDEETEVELGPQSKRQRAEPASRFSQPVDPDAEKKKKRERMLVEIRQLEADIKLAERENERVRKATAAGKDPKRPANADQLLEMLGRTMAAPPTLEGKPKHAPSVLDNVGLFLPFARPPKPKERSVEEILKTEDLPSVLPVEVANPMPFLSAFTPFTCRSKVCTLPPTPGAETGEADILQVHSITTSAPHLLFSSRLSVTVNTRNGTVDRIDIEYLDPAAERELGPWVRKRAQGGVLGRDINSISWASQQWYESASRRGKFWCQVESELSTPDGRDRARRRVRQEARRGRKSQPAAMAEPEEHFEDDEDRKFTPDQLRRNMGRQSMDVEVGGATLTLNWKLDFDWTGEAQQAITAAVKVPKRWHEMDERRQLDRIPEIFQGLVKERSPAVAARSVVVMLMGD